MSDPKKEVRPVEVPKNWADLDKAEQDKFIDDLIEHWVGPSEG